MVSGGERRFEGRELGRGWGLGFGRSFRYFVEWILLSIFNGVGWGNGLFKMILVFIRIFVVGF